MHKFEVAQSIESLFTSSCQELLVGMNCEVSVLPLAPGGELDGAPMASIDAGSSELEIAVALELPMSVLALTYPVPDMSEVNDESLEDWVSELSNQLMGRLKAKLIQHQQEVVLGLPTTTFGIALDDIIKPGPFRFSVYFDVDGEICGCHVGIEFFADDLKYTHEAEVSSDMLMESEIELF